MTKGWILDSKKCLAWLLILNLDLNLGQVSCELEVVVFEV